MNRLCITTGAVLLLAGISLPLHARTVLRGSEAATADVTIKGVIISPPPCTINNNNTINVNFGNAVDISKVDGKNYLTDISYSLQCTGNTSDTMTLSIQGTPADFDSGAALEGGHGGLGIELLHDGDRLKLGDKIAFTYPTLPSLQAVPVKKEGATLETGEFSVGATMVVDWQ